MAAFVGVQPTKGREIAAMKTQSSRYAKKRQTLLELQKDIRARVHDYTFLAKSPYERQNQIDDLLSQQGDTEHQPIKAPPSNLAYWKRLSANNNVVELENLKD